VITKRVIEHRPRYDTPHIEGDGWIEFGRPGMVMVQTPETPVVQDTGAPVELLHDPVTVACATGR
jgi:hypothetical protein